MRDADFTWLADHGPELHLQYAGKWIAVRDGQVVGVGDTAPEAVRQAEENFPEGDFILEALDRTGDVIYASV